MRVTFCFSTHNYKCPIGGFKIVYEYANQLIRRGYEVSIVFCVEDSLREYNIPQFLRYLISKEIVRHSPKWFHLDAKVKKIAALHLTNEYIPDSDIIFATAATTAKRLSRLSNDKGEKYYLIQGYENWKMTSNELHNTYQMGMRNIVVSNWLYNVVSKYSANTFCIQNPIDIDMYKVFIPIENRNKFCFGMLYHDGEYKGSKYTIEVLKKIKEKYPETRVIAFGNPDRPADMPHWFEYHQHAKTEEVIKIYNQCAVFVCSSIIEGYGLTGLESMACGCAFISTDYQGALEYAKNNYNALLSPIMDTKSMIYNIEYLLNNDEERIRIANNAVISSKKYTWDIAVDKLESIFNM